jgi:uncharacterized coiled-coil DUF342 family protein
MSTASKLRKSRNQWKQKASARADELRYFRKELKRVKRERDDYKKEAKENKAKVIEAEKPKKNQHGVR